MVTKQQGFTLVELMIALALGLIITAAAVGIYIANYRTLASQKSSGEMQSASLFGIQPLESRLRMANLGNEQNTITDSTPGGGIVLSTTNADVESTLLSSSGEGLSNTDTGSDQLTIQFTNVTPTPIYNCEGGTVPTDTKTIERYFVREGNDGLTLACDAGTFNGNDLTNFGDDGVEMIAGVDQFRVMLGTQSRQEKPSTTAQTGQRPPKKEYETVTQYHTISDYDDLEEEAKVNSPIVSIKVGVIARGTTPISISEGLTDFTLFGSAESLKDGVSKGFVRNTYETTTLLRNARAINFDSNNSGEVN